MGVADVGSGGTGGRDVELPDTTFCSTALVSAESQLRGFIEAYGDSDKSEEIPRAYDGVSVNTVSAYDWTSGFVAGTLWHLYDYTSDPDISNEAREWTEALSSQQFYSGDHDLGFKMNNSYGHGYRMAGIEEYLPVVIQTSETLLTRYSEATGVIESWDSFGEIAYPVIIDNMMNLEMLFFSAENGGGPTFFDVAVSHADTTLENHFRPDGSSYHVLGYDPTTGEVTHKVTAQGLADESAWARGQAWGLYGFTMSYRMTNDTAYLEQAQKIADFLIEHPNTPSDGVYYFDFDAPTRDDVPDHRDASASAISASALLELQGFLPQSERSKYLEFALHQLWNLTGPSYSAALGQNGHFLLMHSVGHYPAGSEVDVAINYADYYYMEALIRCTRLAH
jgi:rhamnogalacturonyl hydrolase YesR